MPDATPSKPRRPRLARSSDGAQVTRLGMPRLAARELYYYILIQSWTGFYAILIALYLLANCVFATLYWLLPGSVAESGGQWPNDFFFSIETMATVGYGVMHPDSLAGHVLVVIEILFGVLAVPVATGLTIVKFARPTARIIFARRVTLAPYDGRPTLMFRVANGRSRGLLEAHVKITLLREVVSAEGMTTRRLFDMNLLRDNSPTFALSWTLFHPIDEASPLYGLPPDRWLDEDLVFVCVLTGIDETSSSTVHARYTYYADDIVHGHVFRDVISTAENGRVILDMRQFHEVAPVAATT